MKRFLSLVAATLVAAISMAQVSGKLVIPKVAHANITVTRAGASLADGDIVTEGETLVFNYEAESPYYIVGETTQSITLDASMFSLDVVPSLIIPDFLSWGWTEVTSGSQHENRSTGWKKQMPPYGSTGSVTAGPITLDKIGNTKVPFIWSINQDFINYGHFILTCSLNGEVKITRDFTVNVNPAKNMLYDTLSFVGTGSDVIEWRCNKTASDNWADDGRWFYMDSVMVMCEADATDYLYKAPVPAVQRDFYLEFEQPYNATLEVTVNGAPFTKGTVHEGDVLHYVYTASRGYLFVSNDDTVIEEEIVLQESDFNTSGVWIKGAPATYLLDPSINISTIDASSAQISWDGYGVYESYRLLVAAEQPTGNPDYWKGLQNLTDTSYVAIGLVEGQLYYVYLEATVGSTTTDWIITTFTFSGTPDACHFTILMRDSYGDGWNGNTLRIIENGEETLITLKDGGSGVATYASHGELVQIVWKTGSYANEVSFSILDYKGNTIFEGYGDSYSNEEVIFEGVLCSLCNAALSNLEWTTNTEGTEYTLNWNAENADHFEVAVLQKTNPSLEELENAAVVTTQTSYTFNGESSRIYHAFVRPVCSDDNKGIWEDVVVCQTIYDFSDDVVKANAKTITLDYKESGDLMENAFGAGPDNENIYPLLVYKFSLADSTQVNFSFSSREIDDYSFILLQDTLEGKPLKQVAMFNYDTRVLKGNYYVLLQTNRQFGEYQLKMQVPKELIAKPIQLDYSESGDFSDCALWEFPFGGDMVPAKAFSFTPSDTVNVRLSLASSNTSMGVGYFVFVSQIESDKMIASNPAGMGWSDELLKDSTYYILLAAIPSYGGLETDTYEFSLKEQSSESLVAKPIELDYSETGDFMDCALWEFPFGGDMVPAKAFSITPADTMTVRLSLGIISEAAVVPSSSAAIALLKGNSMITLNPYENPIVRELSKDSVYTIIICTLPSYGGAETYQYSFKAMRVDNLPPTPTTLLTPDVYLEDSYTSENFVKEMTACGKVYEYVINEDKRISFSVEYLGEDDVMAYDLRVGLYKDTIVPGDYIDYNYATSTYFEIEKLSGSSEGTHYYFVIYNPYSDKPAEYRFILREEPDYGKLPIKDSIDLNKAYTSAISVADGYTYHGGYGSPAGYEAFKVRLEKDKDYRFLCYLPSINDYDGYKLTIFNPHVQTGGWSDRILTITEDVYNEHWMVLPLTADTTADFTFMFDVYDDDWSKFLEDSTVYKLSVEEVIPLTEVTANATLVTAPYTASGKFSDNKKVMPDAGMYFHTPISYLEDIAAYDALAVTVSVAAGDTLFVEFGGDADAAIHIYDPALSFNSDNPVIVDYISYNYPYEAGYVVNESSDPIDYIVVCSFNDILIEDAAYSLRIAMSEKDIAPIKVSPKADKESITIYESDGVAAAQAELGKLILKAVNESGDEVALLVNNPFVWQIDLNANTARYEFNDSDLPLGYLFENPIMWVDVLINRIPDLPTAIEDTFEVNSADDMNIRKVLRNGHIYIITPNGTFDIVGRKVQ